MQVMIDNLVFSRAAERLNIYCPETVIVKSAFDALFDSVLKTHSYKGPDIAALYFNKFVSLAKNHNVSLAGKRIMDFGCGQARPLELSILLYLCGARRVLAIDLREISDQAAVSVMAAGTIIAALSGKLIFDHEQIGVGRETIRRQAANFDIEKLLRNDIAGGVPDDIWIRQEYYANLPQKERAFDIMVSNSVFEHVSDLPTHFAQFRANIDNKGVIYIAIDYKDHRIYSAGSKASMWQYLMDGDDGNGDINCVRHTRFLEMATAAGFEVLECLEVKAYPSEDEKQNFLPEYRDISELDLTTVAAHVLLQPKATTQTRGVSL